MRDILTLLAIMLNVWIGLPCLWFGILGVTGTFADTSLAENRAYGVFYLAISCSIAVPTVFLFRSKK